MVLVDTSIRVGHFRDTNEQLIALLSADQVVCHPFIVAEIACGTPPDRARTLFGLNHLRQIEIAATPEVMEAVEMHRLYGRGCGFVDLSLLTSVLANPNMKLWTLDKSQAALAAELHLEFRPPLHS